MRFGWERFKAYLYAYPDKVLLAVNTVQEDSSYTTLQFQLAKPTGPVENYFLMPFKNEYKNESYTAMPVGYTGQKQNANDNTGHIGAYDYMTSNATVSATSGFVSLRHYGSILRIEIPCYKEVVVNSLVLTTNGNKFVTSANINVKEQTFTPTAYSDSMELKMENVSVQQGQCLVAYAVLAPTDLSDEVITVKVKGTEGEIDKVSFTGANIEAGKLYVLPASVNKKEIEKSDDGTAAAVDYTKLGAVVAYAPDFLLAETADDELKRLTPLKGDVNGDGSVTMADANLVVNYYLSGSGNNGDIEAYDVNDDGSVTMADANMIVNIFLNQQ